MLYFKSCLRCEDGMVELGSDNYGSFLSCLTCGYTINSRSIRWNGSIEQPVMLKDDLVVVSGLAPVANADDPGTPEASNEFDPDIAMFVDEMEDLAIDIEEAAAI